MERGWPRLFCRDCTASGHHPLILLQLLLDGVTSLRSHQLWVTTLLGQSVEGPTPSSEPQTTSATAEANAPPYKKPSDVTNSPCKLRNKPKEMCTVFRLKVCITWGQCHYCGDVGCTGVQKWLFMAINPPTAPLARTESAIDLLVLASDNAHL